MAKKPSIKEQVAALTPEQKEKLPRIKRIATAVQLTVCIPGLLFYLLGLLITINDPSILTRSYRIGHFMVGAFVCIFALAVLLFIKIRYPYYSEAKANYIIKQKRRGEPV